MRKWGIVAVCAVALVGITVAAAEKAPESFSKLMKDNGAALQSLGKAADSKDYDTVAKNAASLQANFKEVGKFWTERKNQDALATCGAAFKAASELEAAAKAKNDMALADARKALGGACQSCHQAHREKMPDGTFELK